MVVQGWAATPLRTVRSDRLILEPQLAAHAEEMFHVLGDPAIYEHEGEPPASLEWLRERYRKLESRASADGREQWLNWVVRLPDGKLIGYVQATVAPSGRADIAYVMESAQWGKGLASEAVRAMTRELAARHGARRLSAVLKRENLRSLRLLERLGFSAATPAEPAGLEPDEIRMTRDMEEP